MIRVDKDDARLSDLLTVLSAMPLPNDLASVLAVQTFIEFEALAVTLLYATARGSFGLLGFFNPDHRAPKNLETINIWDDNSVAQSIRERKTVVIPESEKICHQYPGAKTRLVAPIEHRAIAHGALLIDSKIDHKQIMGIETLISKLTPALAAYLRIIELENNNVAFIPPAQSATQPTLSERQIAILALLAEGNTKSQIAHKLGYSPATIHQDVVMTYRLLDVHNKESALSRGYELGLFEPINP